MRLLSDTIFKDGKTKQDAKVGGVWTLNLINGNLFLFKANPTTQQEGEGVGEVEGDGEGGREIIKGVELSKLLKKPGESCVSIIYSTSSHNS